MSDLPPPPPPIPPPGDTAGFPSPSPSPMPPPPPMAPPTPAPGPGWWLASDGRWYPPQAATYGYGQAAPAYTGPRTTNALAVTSMILGIVWIFWLGSVLAIIFGHIALNQINHSHGAQGGRGMAIAGLVLGYVGIGFLVLGVIGAATDSSSTTIGMAYLR